MELEFKTVSVTISGDCYQVLFHDDLDAEDEPYFMIQRQFEFPDDEVCHFESHYAKLCEHSKAQSAFLTKNKLHLSYGKNEVQCVEIIFGTDSVDYKYLVSTLKEMIPWLSLEV